MLKSRIPKIIATSSAGAPRAVETACARIERRAKEKSRVRTGNMRGGWQTQINSPVEGVVFNLVSYTIYNEYGTVNMSAQPMLRPAVDETKPEFEKDVRALYL